MARNLNTKHYLWNSCCTNAADSILYPYAQNSDYSIIAPDTPTRFSTISHYRPDVLDISITKLLQQTIEVINLNQLSFDHNPILLTTTNSHNNNSPSQVNLRVNWKKFSFQISYHMQNITPLADSTINIDTGLIDFTHSIRSAVNNSVYKKPTNHNSYSFYPEISLEIELKYGPAISGNAHATPQLNGA